MKKLDAVDEDATKEGKTDAHHENENGLTKKIEELSVKDAASEKQDSSSKKVQAVFAQ